MKSTADTDEDSERYVSIETTDGELVIYDQDETTAWLQSDYTVEIGT